MGTPKLPCYIFSEKLGSGTYATVYKAFKKTGCREVVAIKCVTKRHLNRISTENLLKEIELLKKLRHEHIVGLVDFSWDADYIYLVLEYCSGGDLSRFIRQRRRLPESIVRRFLRQLASALYFLRQHQIVHMDLKPQNLLLSNSHNPCLKVADFGFAHYLNVSSDEEAVALDQVRGSLLYMAPEIVTQRLYSPKCDLWSTGVILFECLFGKAPFASESYAELGDKIRAETPVHVPFSSEISNDCHDLLCRLLQRDPSKRCDYPEFFGHPFVDLEHAPSPQNLLRGCELSEKALAVDRLGNRPSEALQIYTEALRFLIPVLQNENDSGRKETLRTKVSEYIDRAENLRTLLTEDHQLVPLKRSVSDDSKRLLRLSQRSRDCAELLEASERLISFYTMIDAENYPEALSLFESIAEKALPYIKADTDYERKRHFHEEFSRAMSIAEQIKNSFQAPVHPTSERLRAEEDNEAAIRKDKSCQIM